LFAARLGYLIKSGKLQTHSERPSANGVVVQDHSGEEASQAVTSQTGHKPLTMEELNIDMDFLAGPPSAAKH
jgi:hypothetical protein